jgi:hypothetical protein
MECMITEPTCPMEVTAQQPESVAVETNESTPIDSADAARDGIAENGRDFQVATRRESASTPNEEGNLEFPGRPAISEILPEDPTSWELAVGDDEVVDAGISPDGSQPDYPLTHLAKQIVKHRQRMLRAARTAVDEYIRIGRALIDAKGLCKHGQWAPFLARCGLKQRTAEQFMQFARNSELIDRESHGRADLTVEAVRKLIASRTARARSPKSRSVTGSIADGTGEENECPDPGAPSRSAHRDDATVDSAEDEPPVTEPSEPNTTTGATESTAEGPLIVDIVDLAEPLDPGEPDTDRSKSEGSEAQSWATEPDQPSDQEWLARIPLREQLDDPTSFDRNAILWRRVQPQFARLLELVAPSPEELGNSAYFRMARNRFRLRLLFGMGVRDPRDWTICPRCRGGFTDRPGTMPCSGCDGGGYLLTHHGDFREGAQE